MRIYKVMVYFLSMIGLVAVFTYLIFTLAFFKEELETGRIIRIGRRVYGVLQENYDAEGRCPFYNQAYVR